MTPSRPPAPPNTPDAELEAADFLLGKADALLRRHRNTDSASQEAPPANDEDLPLLTEVVDDDPTATATDEVAQAAPAPEQTRPASDPAFLTEILIRLDTEIALQVEAWLANELPQLLTRELDGLAERVRSQALAQLRATLLPALSDSIAAQLDKIPPQR